MNVLSSIQAVAHGSDTVQYFQWRKSRGSSEKLHGAVVDHGEAERTRVFQDIAAHGAFLTHLDGVVGTTVRPDVAIVYDWEVRWALMYTQGPRQNNPRTPFDKEYLQTVQDHYRPFWKLGIPVDIIERLSALDRYTGITKQLTDPRTLKARKAEHVYVIGDNTNVATSKAGSCGSCWAGCRRTPRPRPRRRWG